MAHECTYTCAQSVSQNRGLSRCAAQLCASRPPSVLPRADGARYVTTCSSPTASRVFWALRSTRLWRFYVGYPDTRTFAEGLVAPLGGDLSERWCYDRCTFFSSFFSSFSPFVSVRVYVCTRFVDQLHESGGTGTAFGTRILRFLVIFFLSLQGSILRSDPYSLGETLDLSPDFLSWRLGAQTEFLVSHILPGRAIHGRLHQCRGFWKMVCRALQSPRRLASRQFLLPIFMGTLEITVIFVIVYAFAWNFQSTVPRLWSGRQLLLWTS